MQRLKTPALLVTVLGALAALLVAMGLMGLHGIEQSNQALKTVYEDRTVAVALLADVQHQLLLGRLAIDSSVLNPTPEVVKQSIADLESHLAAQNRARGAYLETYLTPQEQTLVNQFSKDRERYTQEGLAPALAALRARNTGEALRLILERLRPLEQLVQADLEALMKLQVNVAGEEYTSAADRYVAARTQAIIEILAGVLVAILGAFALRRANREEVEAAQVRKSHAEVLGLLIERNQFLLRLGQQQAELQQSELRWRSAIDGAGDGVWDRDVTTGVETYSRRWKEMLGYSEFEILPDHEEWENRIHADDRAMVLSSDRAYLDGVAERYHVEYRMRCKDNSYKWILSRGVIVSRDASGAPERVIGTHLDITQRKLVEEALRESNERLRGLYELSPLGIALADMSGHFVDFNPAFQAMCGYDEQELKDLDYWKLTPAKYIDDEAAQMEKLASTGRYGPYEKEYIRKDGSLIPLSLNGMQIIGRDGKPYIWSIAEDISLRRQHEAENRQSLDTLRLRDAALSQISQGVLISDGNRLITYANDEFVRITGYARDEIIGKPCSILQGPDTDLETVVRMRTALNSQQTFQGEVLNYRKDGSPFWNDLTMTPVFDERGRLSQFIGVQRDITEAKLNQILLVEQERRLQLLINSVPALIGYWDKQLSCRYGNRVYSEWFGIDPAKMIGMHARDVVGEKRYQETLPRVEAALRGERQRFEGFLTTRQGQFLQTMVEYVPDLQDGVVRGFYAVAFDVSELKAGQLAMHAAKEVAESANVAKSQFLANMSHEVRTPMNGILGMAQLLMLDDIDEKERVDYARTILTSGQTLLRLLNDVLDLAKIESGKVDLESIEISPVQIMAHVQELFSQAAQAKGVQIVSGWRGPVASYLGDPHRLTQMLSNLVGNALKFTHQGSIRIEASEVASSGSTATLELSVTDTGIGIPEDKMERLFQNFSQVDASTTRQYGGTGLGLSIVRTLAQAMGGEVGVESEAGKGSRFWFRIQAERLAVYTPSPEEPLTAQSLAHVVRTPQSARVLVVEDNPDHQRLVEVLLGRLGLNVSTAEDGQQALDLIMQGDKAQLVLMDLNMPVLDGYTATQKIRQWEQDTGRARRTIVALTANAFEHDRLSCLAVGMDEVLTKPVLFDKLQATLAHWLPELVDPERAEKALDIQRVQDLLHELYPMLENNQVDAIARFKHLQEAVTHTRLELPVAQAGAALQNFEFEAALAQLQGIVVA